MRLLFIGFGTVGQGLSELLLAKRDELAASYGFDAVVVGIADMLKGSAYDPDGLDLAEALARVGRGESLSDWPGVGRSWDALAMIAEADADAMLEATYTDIKTGQPATEPHPRRPRARHARARRPTRARSPSTPGARRERRRSAACSSSSRAR